MDRWVGRVAIVTGASSGIGAAIAKLLAEQGMKVVGVARRVDRVKSLAAELGKLKGELHAISGDVTREEDVTRVVTWTRENLGGADVLVNCAGVFYPCQLTDCATQRLKAMLDTNVLGLSMMTRDVIKCMRSRGVDDGHIFHINSVAGHRIVEYPGIYFHSAAKHAVTVVTEGLRRELRDLKTKIRVTSISPGLVKTEILEAAGSTPEESEQAFTDNPALEPRDIAEGLLYALSTPKHVQVHEITIQPVGDAL